MPSGQKQIELGKGEKERRERRKEKRKRQRIKEERRKKENKKRKKRKKMGKRVGEAIRNKKNMGEYLLFLCTLSPFTSPGTCPSS